MATVVLISALVACGDAEETAVTSDAHDDQLEVGKQGEDRNVAVTVADATELDPSDATVPEAGNRFVGVEVVIENLSEEEISVSALQQMTLYDNATSREFSPDMSATNLALANQNATPTLEGTLSGGDEMRGLVGFQVPDDATELVFMFDPITEERHVEPLRFELDI